jgi:hypothetical protein
MDSELVFGARISLCCCRTGRDGSGLNRGEAGTHDIGNLAEQELPLNIHERGTGGDTCLPRRNDFLVSERTDLYGRERIICIVLLPKIGI